MTPEDKQAWIQFAAEKSNAELALQILLTQAGC